MAVETAKKAKREKNKTTKELEEKATGIKDYLKKALLPEFNLLTNKEENQYIMLRINSLEKAIMEMQLALNILASKLISESAPNEPAIIKSIN